MRLSLKWALTLLLVLVFMTLTPSGHAGDRSQTSPLLTGGKEEALPSSIQARTTGAGMEPLLLAKARNIPDGKPKAKKMPKVKGPAPGSGCDIHGILMAGTGGDIEITQPCGVGPGTYNYGFVNIHSGGKLVFTDATIDFWARSILVENDGSLIVGSFADPIGNTNINNIVTFHLYGDDNQTAGITCKTTNCGVDASNWVLNPSRKMPLPGGVTDYFYQYQRLPADDNQTGGLTADSYFGLKTLAVSYGGTLQMFGQKGAIYQTPNPHDTPPGPDSGISWVRLNQNVCPPSSVNPGCVSPDKTGTQLVLDRVVNWQVGDWIVVTATDYLPSHSEKRQIAGIATTGQQSVITVTVPLSYPHNGQPYDLTQHNLPDRLNDNNETFMTSVDTRAAVALLSRSIRIVSEVCSSYDPATNACPGLPAACNNTWNPSKNQCSGLPEQAGSYFGGHVIARQGFTGFQMKGVELKQLGQGGRMAHSPVNFHMARQVPTYGNPNITYVMACSVNESMTRMYEIRGTQGVILKRNVGYKSIGHGYFLAEGTETGNTLTANLGIYARPAVTYRDNPRNVPGILASAFPPANNFAAYGTDYIHPSVFYIANGYNHFEGNMAVGAGTCGACYWIAPVKIGGLSQTQSWESYAGIQRNTPGTAPLYRFHGNFCSTAQYSLITIDSPGVCSGVATPWSYDPSALKPIYTPFDRAYQKDPDSQQVLYPNIAVGAALQPTYCGGTDCSSVYPSCGKGETINCAVNVIDSYTSSFHWAQQNFAAVWLRTYWFLFTNSALTDVLNGGLTMVSGGSWDQVINRYWALTRKSVFIGQTQDDNESIYAQNWGPVNPNSSGILSCQGGSPASYCRVLDQNGNDEGVVIPADNFSVYQRLYNIYDGPVYQEANAFLNIKKRLVTGCSGGGCGNPSTNFLYYRTPGILKATEDPFKGECIMPNAAIGWKQPNGFYYPPAFHSQNLFFDDVDIRHFVIVPLFKPGTFDVDVAAVQNTYCTYPPPAPQNLFYQQFTDIDRQTELNDNDGSLSGLSGAAPQQVGDTNGTIAVNKDQFYYAPKTAFECLAEQSCYQSPYDYVSAVVYPGCISTGSCGNWTMDCTDWQCYGVPIFRQFLNAGETAAVAQGIKMLGTAIGQRSTMIANQGNYYIDTAMTEHRQTATGRSHLNMFYANQNYNFFLLYAKPTTNVTFQLYVGESPNVNFHPAKAVNMIRVGTNRFLHQGSAFDNATVLVTPLECDEQTTWPDGWARSYDPNSGILTVTMNLAGFADSFEQARAESCGPPSFCQWNATAGECRCARQDVDFGPIGFACDNSSNVCGWSSLRSECPSGGCFGFQVTLPTGFVADDDNASDSSNPIHRPAPTAFPVNWNVGWQKAPYPLAFDASVPWDQDFYPAPGPCDYNDNATYPKNAPLPSSN
jgi:hypothetical protein